MTPHDIWDTLLGELEQRRRFANAMGGPERLERERENGRSSARDRIGRLSDAGTFHELGSLTTMPTGPGAPPQPTSFICGLARIDGRPVAVGAEDFTVQGGATGVQLARHKGPLGGFIEELAFAYEVPLVLLLQGVGGSVMAQEAKGFSPLLPGMSLFPMLELLGRVPVVAGVFGPTAGSSAARAAAAHFSIMSEPNGCLFVGGPPVVKEAIGVDIDKMTLGGADVHARGSGVIDNVAQDEDELIATMRRFLSYLPSNVRSLPPRAEDRPAPARPPDEILNVVPANGRRPYDVRELIECLVDAESVLEVAPAYGRSLCAALVRIDGHPVGMLASDPRHLAGALDGAAAEKQARFVELCDTFHLPLVYLADVPGFMVGPESERTGVLRRGLRAIQAIHRASVPVFTVQVRRSFGLAANATGNSHGNSIRYAWPTGQWGDMPAPGGVEAAFGQQIKNSDDPAAMRAQLLKRFGEIDSMWRTVELFGGVEEVIDPRETREVLQTMVKLAYETARPGPKAGPQVRV